MRTFWRFVLRRVAVTTTSSRVEPDASAEAAPETDCTGLAATAGVVCASAAAVGSRAKGAITARR